MTERTRWEYTSAFVEKQQTNETLRTFGEQGWECFSVKYLYYDAELRFKRPILPTEASNG